MARIQDNLECLRGRITKVYKHPNQTNVLVQGINGTYLEFGGYYGVSLDIAFALYDTDKERNFLHIGNKRFKMPSHITFDIYNEIMAIWQKQRMSPERYASVRRFEGKKVNLIFLVEENKLESLGCGLYAVNISAIMPFTAYDNAIIVRKNITIADVDYVEQ